MLNMLTWLYAGKDEDMMAMIWAQQIMLGKKFQFPPREGGDLAP